ncbi:MAG TPA: MaoC family dehydratase, partial [Desulfurivibrionaceae bacterium]|nr:MaoC family dehydratase [Desulfurivibrionaceae bacterium]
MSEAAAKAFEHFKADVGNDEGTGEWFEVTQEQIDRFADITHDHQFIHVDPEAAKATPFGTTIAHGFLTLSLLPLLTESNAAGQFERNYPGMRLRVNYGLNKVRFPAPVPCGAKLRARTALLAAEPMESGVQLTYRITVEIEGQDKPACVAEQLFRLYP